MGKKCSQGGWGRERVEEEEEDGGEGRRGRELGERRGGDER